MKCSATKCFDGEIYRRPSEASSSGGVMRVRSSGHWLDYDWIALVVLVIGIGLIALLVLSI
jgi:hypothetical protein